MQSYIIILQCRERTSEQKTIKKIMRRHNGRTFGPQITNSRQKRG
uniref:Uncharacterized protein n=1 Tax=Rhizophora mucronata TaxID=61149 RepID=A0A2P2PM16_RHIMU